MLSIQKLRNKAGLLITIVIGLALVAFVLGDIMNPNKSSLFSKDNIVLKVNGQGVLSTEYFDLQKQLESNYQSNGQTVDDNTRNMIAMQSWDQLLRQVVLQQEYEKLGLGVKIDEHGIIGITPKEIRDLIVGNNVDPQIQQIFRNQETGAFDKSLALNFLQNMDKDPEKKQIWLTIEKQLIENRMATKYAALLTQGIYTTSVEAKMLVKEKSHKVDISYVQVPFFTMPDSAFKPTTEELEAYLSKHNDEFKQETSRDIDYVVFPVKASQADVQSIQKSVYDLSVDFKTTENDENFVNSNSSIGFDSKFHKKGTLPAVLDSFAFNGSKGDMCAPYFDGEYIKVSKISKIQLLADSVKARHILVTTPNAQQVIDSLKGAIEKGENFSVLAFKYSEDKGSKMKGGELDWFKEGQMVRPFNDTCFMGKVGKLYVVPTQYGIHLIEILQKGVETKKVQLATLAAKIEASTATRNMIYAEANKFAGENNTAALFQKSIESNAKIDKRVATELKPADRVISGIESARQIVRWMYDSKKGDVSSVFDCTNSFVVACVKATREKGSAQLETVKMQIETEVVKEKKAAKILADIAKAGAFASLSELSAKLKNVQVRDAAGIVFSTSGVAGVGLEPSVVGVATVLPAGKVSKPIVGNSGVFVLVVNKVDETPVSDIKLEQDQQTRMNKSRFGYYSFNVLKDKSDIEDNRLLFE